MNRSPYSSYHGRKSLGRRVLTAIAVILAVVLALAVVAWFVLPDYMTYTADGLQFNLPLPGRGQSKQTAQPQPSQDIDDADPGFVIDEPTPTPAPSAGADLSAFERREIPRGLVVAAGEGPGEGQGFIFDMRVPATDPDRDGSAQFNRSLLYAAAYVDPAWDSILAQDGTARTAGFSDYITAWCLDAAARGYDEIILAESVAPDNDPAGQAQAALYRRLKKELDEAGWRGRLSLVLDQSLAGAGYDEDLMPAIAQSFERLYFRSSLQAGVQSALEQGGFDSAYANIVTVYAAVPNVNFYWAVLPQ